MKNFEDLGKFWLPETNDIVVQGKLLRDLERHPGLEVYDELVGQTFESKDSFVMLKGAPIIQGTVPEGDITLVDNSLAGASVGYGQSVQTFRAKLAFLNKHYNSIDEIQFTGVKFSLFNIEEWLNISGFKRYYEPYKIEFISPDVVSFKISDDTSCHIEFRLSQEIPTRFTIGDYQYCNVVFQYKDAKPFSDILEDIVKFTHFITFCTLEQSHTTSIRFIDVNNVVKCFRFDKFKNPNQKQRQPRFHLLPYQKIKEEFPELILSWFKAFDDSDLRPVLTLVLRIIKSRNALSILTFLDVTRALEVFHRNVLKNQIYDKTVFKNMQRQLKLKMTDEEKKVFSGLHNANNKDLRKRIVELVNEYLGSDELVMKTLFTHEPSDDKIIKGIVDLESFAKVVTDTRNYHTHYSEQYEGKVLEDDNSIRQVTGNLLILLFWCLTKHFGFANYHETRRVLGVY